MSVDTSVAGSLITQEEKVAKKVAKGFNVKAGSLGSILTSQNPAEQRKLGKRLERLESERRRRVGHMTWNQRNFFIKQVFDQDNDFRFVKAEQRPAYMAGIPTAEEENAERESRRESYPVLTDKRPSLTGKRGSVSGFNGEGRRQTKARLPKIRVKSLGIFASGTQFRRDRDSNRSMTRRSVQLTNSRPLTRTQSTMSLTQSRLVRENTDICLKEREQETDIAGTVATGKMDVVQELGETDKDSGGNVEQKNQESGAGETSFNEHQRKLSQAQLLSTASAQLKVFSTSMRREQTTIGVGKQEALPILVAPASAPNSPRKSHERKPARERTDLSIKTVPLTGEDREKTCFPEIKRKYRFELDEIEEAELEEAAREEAKEKEREKLLRRLTRTLPTHLMVKTYQRESEAGAESSISSKKKRLLEKSRKEIAKNVLSDPRFTNMVRSLTICK